MTALSAFVAPQSRHRSCATFVMPAGGSVLVGHNLDEANPVPGLAVVNPRGLAKSNWTYGEINAGSQSASSPSLPWT
jgi:hypothetical protein